ncbi:MAG TPA: glutathione S-transferase N-terminal domain-containing protein [Polyangiaceae bacterium]|nr:glutathione S-transferase N-terminal domain-containing protein [Polyangiaceae bacterium]
MKLYFSPLSCSMATRISLYEAGGAAEYEEVDPKTKKTLQGRDFLAINPLGLVPVLEMDDGAVLSENAAILQFVAERFPASELAPSGGASRLREWLSFIGTELHKGLFVPLLDKTAPEGAKSYALSKADSRLARLASALEAREFLLDGFSVADAYLFTVLNWCAVTPVQLQVWPAIARYHRRIAERPAVARAFEEEKLLYGRQLQRHGQLDAATASALGIAPA